MGKQTSYGYGRKANCNQYEEPRADARELIVEKFLGNYGLPISVLYRYSGSKPVLSFGGLLWNFDYNLQYNFGDVIYRFRIYEDIKLTDIKSESCIYPAGNVQHWDFKGKWENKVYYVEFIDYPEAPVYEFEYGYY